jgi:hypothetical protein
MSKTEHSQSYIDHKQRSKRRQDEWSSTRTVRETVAKCARALELGQRKHYYFVGRKTSEVLVPLLLGDQHPRAYGRRLGDADLEAEWRFDAIESFVESPQVFVAMVAPDRATRQATGVAEDVARQIIEGAFESCTAIAEYEGTIKAELKTRTDTVGFATKIGEHVQDAEMDFGDPVEGIVGDKGTVKSLFSGSTGSGKSTVAERQFEDYYRQNVQSGRSCKCIDLVDFTSGENLFYNVPQQQGELQRVREDFDLPADFAGVDGFTPEMEALVPLTPNLDRERMPFDVEAEAFVAQPFAIPASSISKELFTTILTARVSRGERNTIRDVYETVDRRMGDWALADMAEEIAHRDELSDKHKKTAIRVLRSLQDMGMIRRERDVDDAYLLDWDEIFTSTDRITAFSQSLCPDETAQLFVLAWLFEMLWERRRQMATYPQMALLLRELWEYVPHGRRDSDSDTQAALQERIAYILTRMQRKNRDIRTHIIGDTQAIGDLHKGVRELFNRYVLLDGNDQVYEDVFSWTSNSKWRVFKSTITERPGEAGIVGLVGPAIERPNIEFISPVRLVPPSFHHHDKDEGSGWRRRVQYVDSEELRRPDDWPVRIPEDLSITAAVASTSDGEEQEETTDPKEFHRYEARSRARNGESVRSIREAIDNNPDTDNPYSLSTIHGWIDDMGDEDPPVAGMEAG